MAVLMIAAMLCFLLVLHERTLAQLPPRPVLPKSYYAMVSCIFINYCTDSVCYKKSFKLINRDLLNILVEMVNVSGSHMHAVWDSQIHMHAAHCIIVLNLQLFMQMMMSLEKLCKHSV